MDGSDLPTAEALLVSGEDSLLATALPETYVVHMPTMPTITNVLDDASGFFVRQKAQYLQNLTSYEFRNKYKVYLKPPEMSGTPREAELKALEPNFYVFDAEETSECCHRQCCHPFHALQIRLFPPGQTNVMNQQVWFDRPFRCTCLFEFLCCGTILNPQTMIIYDNYGAKFATLLQSRRNCSCSRWIDIHEGHQEVHAPGAFNHVMSIEMPFCACGPNCCCQSVELKVRTGSSKISPIIGRVANIWPGCGAKSFCSKADNFVMEFPKELLLGHKLALLGSAFFLDYLVFESHGNKNGRHSGLNGRGPETLLMVR
jgi:hypothetical protein